MKLLIPPPLQVLVCAGLMWGLYRLTPQLAFSFSGQQLLAALLCFLGLVLDLSAVRLFFRSKTTVSPVTPEKAEKLVVEGAYRFTRNPMYLGLASILTGFAFWLGNFFAFLPVVFFIWFVTRYQIKPEEEVLLEKFGEEYGEYTMRVRRWI